MNIKIPYGHGKIDLHIPDNCDLTILRPKSGPDFLPEFLKGIDIEDKLLEAALDHPYGMDPLEKILTKNTTVAIVVNDITRATPTSVMLKPILERLEKKGVKKENIDIVFANGSHRAHTLAEREMLLGSDVYKTYRVQDHDAHDTKKLKFFGHTKRGTPLLINKTVADADLRILTGMIKPHCQAGYSAGGKAILPGVAGIETIMYDHSYEAVQRGRIGVIEGNLVRADIEEAAQIVGKSFILNVVLNPEKEIVAAVAGDMIEAHRMGCRILDSMCRYALNRQIDIGIVACGAPVDINFYQGSSGINAMIKVNKPVVKKNGVIILVAECWEGMGHDIFSKWVGHSPEEILDTLKERDFFEEGQWTLQILAECRQYVQIIVVSDEKNWKELEDIGMVFRKTVTEAVDEAIRLCGNLNPSVLVLPNAPYTILDMVLTD
jgi:nickel-dependent lactate racemase